MTNTPLTTPEKIVQFVDAYKSEHGYAPEQSIIASELNLTRQAIRYHFRRMGESLGKHPEYRRYEMNKTTEKKVKISGK